MPDTVHAGAIASSARSAERRNFARYELFGTAQVLTSGEEEFRADVRNVSFSGCYLATRRPIEARDKLILRLDLGGIKMELKGTVIRTENSGFGVQFDAPSFC